MAQRLVFVEDYDLDIAKRLVAGCDVWVNLPRRPMEASGTSGMKATFNGALQLSVLDGWWAEGYDGMNGWAIPGDEDPDYAAADARDALRFYELLEQEVIPLFYERDDARRSNRVVRTDQARARHLRPALQREPDAERLRGGDLPRVLSLGRPESRSLHHRPARAVGLGNRRFR